MWKELGTRIGVDKHGSPINVCDGFYYVSMLSSIEMLLCNEHIFNQVRIVDC